MMSMQPNNATRSIDEQNRREYATQYIFQRIYRSVPSTERRRLIGVRRMEELRREWGMDFSREGFKLSDFEQLAENLPNVPEFDSAKRSLSDETYVKRMVSNARRSYDALIAENKHPVLILDPQLQDAPGMDRVASFTQYTLGTSMRDMNPGESLTMYTSTGIVQYRGANDVSTEVISTAEAEAQARAQAEAEAKAQAEAEAKAQAEDQAAAEAEEDATVVYSDWTTNQDKGVYGLDQVMGAYFTQRDQKKIQEHFDSFDVNITEKQASYLDSSVAILQYLRSNGMDFEVRDFYENGQIEVSIAGTDMAVRIFDLEEEHVGRYIGRVYDSFGYMHVQGNQQNQVLDYTVEESLIPLKYMLGDIEGESQKVASRPNTQIRNVEDLGYNKHIFIERSRHGDRYNSVVYNNEEEAYEYLNKVIEGAGDYFDAEFDLEALREALNDPSVETIDDVEFMLSFDTQIQLKQETFMNDVRIISDMAGTPFADGLNDLIYSFDAEDIDFTSMDVEQEDVAQFVYDQIKSEMVGDLESGINPAFVTENAPEDDYRRHSRNATMAALRYIDYDLNKLKGNEFATRNVKDNLVKFNPDTARNIDQVDDEFLKNAMLRVQENLDVMGVVGADKENSPEILIDDQGLMYWEGHRMILKSSARGRVPAGAEELTPGGKRIESKLISGEIGQVFSPNEFGIIKTNYASGENYGFVPGYTGYFKFDGEYTDDRMDRVRVKGFDQHLFEGIDRLTRQQVSRPLKASWENIPNDFDGSSLNKLYQGDMNGRRIDLDFLEKSKLQSGTAEAIVLSLSNRIRFGNEYGDYATTNAEARAEWDTQHEDQAAFSYWKVVGEKNMRVLHDDLANYADLTMTGNARTQGLTWFLADGATVNEDGTINMSQGEMQLDGTIAPDTSAIRKLPYFAYEQYNAWNRVQMSANELVTAEHVEEGVGTALMSLGGLTYEDSFAISKDFADRNQVQGDHPQDHSMKLLNEVINGVAKKDKIPKEEILEGTGMNWSDELILEGAKLKLATKRGSEEAIEENKKLYEKFLNENGTFRPLKRGDKISDFGGNKGTIGAIIDRNMSLNKSRELNLDREVAIFKANPKLDLVGAPYSPLSRFNAGILHELQDGDVEDVYDPIGIDGKGKTMEGALGRLNIIVTDLTVDNKTQAYSEEDVAEGRGRLASGQLAWALQSHGATDILTEIYGYNDSSWAAFREYLITTGLDMAPDGELLTTYTPHNPSEIRSVYDSNDYETSEEFLNEISDKGGFLKIPFEVEFLTGESTDEVPILSADLRRDSQLIDGTMRRSDYNNYYNLMFDNIKTYSDNVELGQLDDPAKETARLNAITKAKSEAKKQFDNIQNDVKDRQFDGGHNGKHSFIRDKIMGVRMKNSATGVAISDPDISVTEVAMDSEMAKALDVEEGEEIVLWRDPVWRKGAVSSQTVRIDESLHGFGVNPIIMVDKDGDLDGDTLGAFKLNSKESLVEMKTKLARYNNLVDTGSSDLSLYLPDDQDFASAFAEARERGDTRMDDLYESIHKNAYSEDDRLRKQAVSDIDKYVKIAFKEYGYGSDYINLNSRETVVESLNQMVERKTKGSPKSMEILMNYYDGNAGREEAIANQYAKGVQTDDTGLGGARSQMLVSSNRNEGIDAALEVAYPVTQGVLQIKHDAAHAKSVDKLLRKEIVNLYKGHSSDGKVKNMTKSQWVEDYYDVLTNPDKMGVDVRKELVEQVADVMVGDGNTVRDIERVINDVAAPMDQIAYGGGWDKAFELAKSGGRSMLEGEMSQHFAPVTMKEYDSLDDSFILAKGDVRDIAVEKEYRKEYSKNFERSIQEQKAKSTGVQTSVSQHTEVSPASSGTSSTKQDIKSQHNPIVDDGPGL